MTVIVSKHAEKRLKERLGLNRKASQRHALKAFNEGILPSDYPVKDVATIFAGKQATTTHLMYLIYKDCVHIFGLSEETPILVTVYDPLSVEKKKPTYKSGEKIYGGEWNLA